jgi:hypothetical protein
MYKWATDKDTAPSGKLIEIVTQDNKTSYIEK